MEQVLETVTVRTKEDLAKAINQGYSEIIIEGSLAEKVRDAYKLKEKMPFLSNLFQDKEPTLSAMAGALASKDIVAIIAVLFLGIALVLVLSKGYDLDLELSKDKVKVKKTKASEASGESGV